MSHLTGNWKLKSNELGLLLGEGVLAGSYGGGSAQEFINGGLFAVSINENNSIYSITAYEAMSQFYGSNVFASGYKFIPIIVQEKYGAQAYRIFPTGSQTTSRVQFIPQALTINAGVTTSTYTVSYARGVSISANFVFLGLIASTP